MVVSGRPRPTDSNLLVSFPGAMSGRARREVVARLRALGDPAPVAPAALSRGLLAVRTTLEPHGVVRDLRALCRQDPGALRHTSRWVPIDRWTAPDLESMKQAVTALRGRIAPEETWRMTIERRPGTALDPEAVIRTLASLVPAKVNLAHPHKILLVELFVDRVAFAVVIRDEVLAVATVALLAAGPEPSAAGPTPAQESGGDAATSRPG